MQDSDLLSEPMLCRRSTRRSSSQWTAPPSHSGSPRIDLVTLQDHFQLPITEVAKKLGVCATVLKKVCRSHGISRWPHRKIKSLDKQIALLESAKSKGGAPGLKAAEELETIRAQKEILVRNPNGHSSKSGMKHRRQTSSRKAYHAYDTFSDSGSETSSSPLTRSPHRGSTDSAMTFSTSPCASSSVKLVASVSTMVSAPPPRHRSASVSAAPTPRAAPYGRSHSVSSTPTHSMSEATIGRVPRVSCLGKIAPHTESPLPLPSKQKAPHHQAHQAPNPSLPSHHPSVMRSPSPAVPQQSPMSVPSTLPAFTPTGMSPPYSSYVFGNYNYYPMTPHPNFQMMDPQMMRYFAFGAMPPHFVAHPHHGASMDHVQQPAMNLPPSESYKHFAPAHAYGPSTAPTFTPTPAAFAHASPPSSGSSTARSDVCSDSESSASDGEIMSLMDLAKTASPDDSVDETHDKTSPECDNAEGEQSSAMDVDDSSEASSESPAVASPSSAAPTNNKSLPTSEAPVVEEKASNEVPAASQTHSPSDHPTTSMVGAALLPHTLEAY